MNKIPTIEAENPEIGINPAENTRREALLELKHGCEAMEKSRFAEFLPTPGIANVAISAEAIQDLAQFAETSENTTDLKFRFTADNANDALVIRDNKVYAIGTKFEPDKGMFSMFFKYDDLGRIIERESFIMANTYTEKFTYSSYTPNKDGTYEFTVSSKHVPGIR